MAEGPDPRLTRLLAAMRAVRDGDLGARTRLTGDDIVAELGALFDELAERGQRGRDGQAPPHGESFAVGAPRRAGQPAERPAAASRTKAEFLANISHELRTPLSSLLILAKLLAGNAEGNLTARQVDFARTIHGAAQDLLQLINDLLDLSKVETGRIEVRADRVDLAALVPALETAFRPLAEEKGLELAVQIAPDAPQFLDTDRQRLQQILRNLLSNAVKFTDQGKVSLEIGADRDPRHRGNVRFAVRDTGIGIAAQQQQAIFEAFEQGDAAAGQRLSGTGLGLSISRELARLLGGSIRVGSVPGQGSTFTLSVPTSAAAARTHDRRRGTAARLRAQDEGTAAGSASPRTDESGSGAHDPQRPPSPAAEGAARTTAVLVVEPRGARAMQHAARTALDGLGGMPGQVELLALHDNGPDGFERALTGFDVVSILVNLSCPRPMVQALLAAVAAYAPAVPVLVYEAGGGSGTLARLGASMASAPQMDVVGSRAQAVERLTLHLLTALPGSAAELSLTTEPAPAGKRFHGEKVLVVDDDVRNVFAMTSMLELHGLSVVHADNGRRGIETLMRNPDIKLVLMDLMMPGMDGYAATEYIRGLNQFAQLPIIAVTAKAMRGDRERSLAAGANEHVVKPVEVDVLIGMINSMMA